MKYIAVLLAIICGLAGILGAGYIFIFWGIIEPIVDICKAIDTHTVSASVIGWAVVKFFIRDIFAAIVAVVGLGAAAGLMTVSKW